MKSFKSVFITGLAVVALALSSCSKYDDGPAVSLRTKKNRLCRTWVISHYYENDVDKTSDAMTALQDFKLTFDKSGNYNISYRPFNIGDYFESGTWDFIQSKECVQFTRLSPTPTTVSSWKITRLTAKELQARHINSNNVEEKYHLIPQ